jgi:phenylpropionate dioxygenase-like ring-hydroxylating dioxygenase large terminal subunit
MALVDEGRRDGRRVHVKPQTGTYQRVPAEDLAWLGTDPIPARPYYDPAWFELEREAVFKRTWLLIGHISEIAEPGGFIVRPLEVAMASILIVHGKDGKLRAFHNVCVHRGTQLVTEPSGKAASFTCRYHAWTYGYDGELRSAPDFEQFYVDKADCGLRKVAVDVCGGLVFINLDASPKESLREFLGQVGDQLETLAPSRATTFTEYVYEIDANWKVTYDNFQENYHLRFIHPKTGASTIAPDNPFAYPSEYRFYGPHRGQTLWINPDPPKPSHVQALAYGKSIAFATADGVAKGKVDFKLFPNLFLVGQSAWFFSHCVMPVSATRSRGVIRFYWVGEDDCASRRFAREYVWASVRDVHCEDRGIIEAGQRGLSSGALEHIHFQVNEGFCRHLHNEVSRRVEAYQAEIAS